MNTQELDTKLRELSMETGGKFIEEPIGLTVNSLGQKTTYTVGKVDGAFLEEIYKKCKAMVPKGSKKKLLYHTKFGVSPKLKDGTYSVRVAVVI